MEKYTHNMLKCCVQNLGNWSQMKKQFQKLCVEYGLWILKCPLYKNWSGNKFLAYAKSQNFCGVHYQTPCMWYVKFNFGKCLSIKTIQPRQSFENMATQKTSFLKVLRWLKTMTNSSWQELRIANFVLILFW